MLEAVARHGERRPKKIASEVGKKLGDSRKSLVDVVTRVSEKESWSQSTTVDAVLRITYCSYVVMIELRNTYRPYNYMDFSRRIGELWEPFCKICFDYSEAGVELIVPPLFSEVRTALQLEVTDYIDQLNITSDQKAQLKLYYQKVWGLVISGEVKLELDLHFKKDGINYVIDFKSGFGSNEKGNTNRLLLVATIYSNLKEIYKPILLVRAANNNQYYNRLRDSGCWSAYSGDETYNIITELTEFNMREWVDRNIHWANDINSTTYDYLVEKDLDQYLIW